MVERVVRREEVVVPDDRVDAEVAMRADDVAGAEACTPEAIRALGSIALAIGMPRAPTAPCAAASRAGTDVEIAMITASNAPSSNSETSRSKPPTTGTPITSSAQRDVSSSTIGDRGAAAGGRRMSMTWVAPRPAPISAIRGRPSPGASGSGSSTVAAEAAAAAASTTPTVISPPPAGSRGRRRAPRRGAGRARSRAGPTRPPQRACARPPRRRPRATRGRRRSRAIGSVSRTSVPSRARVQDVAALGAVDVDDRLAGLDLGDRGRRRRPARDRRRATSSSTPVSLLTSVVGTRTGFTRSPRGWPARSAPRSSARRPRAVLELGMTSASLAAVATGRRSSPKNRDDMRAATSVPHDQPSVPSSTTSSLPVAADRRRRSAPSRSGEIWLGTTSSPKISSSTARRASTRRASSAW